MASGMPLGGLVPQALLAQQQLAARGPGNVAGQQLRAGGMAAAAVQAAQAQAAENARKLANKKRKAMDKPASEQVSKLDIFTVVPVADGLLPV